MQATLRTTKNKNIAILLDEKHHESDLCSIRIEEQRIEEVQVLSLFFEMRYEAFRESDVLEANSPISIHISHTCEKFMALYHHRDWWTRPKWGHKTNEIPDKTTNLVTFDGEFYNIFLPIPTSKCNTYISGNYSSITLDLFANRDCLSSVNEPVLLYVKEKDYNQGIKKLYNVASEILDIDLLSEKEPLNFTNYIGWCSWDAFYTDISESKIREKVQEFIDKDIPIRWVLYDDGWLNINDNKLIGYEPDKQKFPQGFENLNTWIKQHSKIDDIGVWHAIGGYWGGIDNIENQFNLNYKSTSKNKLIPSNRFFENWYKKLKTSGISFVKVDGQSALKNYFVGDLYIGEATYIHKILEEAVYKYFNGGIINCMGMSQENVFARKTLLTRNSDDFIPHDKTSFREHLLQNVYNMQWQGCLYQLDWDMFWSSHYDVEKHSILRAISGGPIYVSDQVGKSVKKNIMSLCDDDGKILQFKQSPLLDESCIFDSSQVIIKNYCENAEVVAAFEFDKEWIPDKNYFDLVEKKEYASNKKDYQYVALYQDKRVLGICEKLNMPQTYKWCGDDTIKVLCSGTLQVDGNMLVKQGEQYLEYEKHQGYNLIKNIKMNSVLDIYEI